MRLISSAFLFASLVAGALSCGVERRAAQHPSQDGTNARGPLVGAWTLVSLEEPGADGSLHQADCSGSLVFTRDGHMAVQVMYQPARTEAGDGGGTYAQNGYEASFGTYAVDANARTFTYHIEGSLVRSLVGRDLPRAFELTGDQLVVRSSNPDEHWRVVWARAEEEPK